VAITFPADGTVFNFFGAGSPLVKPLFRLFLGLWCVPVDPCFVDSHETRQKLIRIALKQRQTLLWSGLTVAFVVRSEET